MGDTHDEKLQEALVGSIALERLLEAIRKAINSEHSPDNVLTCKICHSPIGREMKGVCADETGQTVHLNCYVLNVIASRKHPVQH